jgi:hypothetical protein
MEEALSTAQQRSAPAVRQGRTDPTNASAPPEVTRRDCGKHGQRPDVARELARDFGRQGSRFVEKEVPRGWIAAMGRTVDERP